MTFDEWLISRLRAAGCYSGTYDGQHGRAVIEALKRYQAQLKLPVTGQADAETVQALRAPAASALAPPQFGPSWFREAQRLMGLREISGPSSNSEILSWAKKLGGWIAGFYKDDDIPWCGLFVSHCLGLTLPEEALPGNPLSALAWKSFGINLDIPRYGAVMVFSREGGGHVGFYVSEDFDCYHVLGGNQGNSVSITRVLKSRRVACRWPKTVPVPPLGPAIRIPALKNSEISKNEA